MATTDKINEIIPERYHLSTDDVSAYLVDTGTVKSIINEKTKLIKADAFPLSLFCRLTDRRMCSWILCPETKLRYRQGWIELRNNTPSVYHVFTYVMNKALTGLGISREEVYIANIVKCRPPQNRVPEQDEAEACLNYLRNQVILIKPKIIVLLGSTALKIF